MYKDTDTAPPIQTGVTLHGAPVHVRLRIPVLDEAQLYFGGITGHGKTSVAKLLAALPKDHRLWVEGGRG